MDPTTQTIHTIDQRVILGIVLRAMRWSWGWNDQSKTWMNWHNTQVVTPAMYDFPSSTEEIVQIMADVQKRGQKVKVVGMGCSPNTMAISPSRMIFVDKLNKILHVDPKQGTVRVQAGVTFQQLNEELPKHHVGLSVLTSISEQSVGGALACAIHGTGGNFGSVSTYVKSLQLITLSGDILECSENENPELFKACLCHLGGFGMISEITLKTEPEFKLQSHQKENTLVNVLHTLNEKIESNEHWRFWYFPHTQMCVEWKANRVPLETTNRCEGDWVASQLKIFNYALEASLLIGNVFPRFNKLVNKMCRFIAFRKESIVVDRSDKVFNFDCLFRQYVNEWSIPREHCKTALLLIKQMIENRPEWGIHFPIEVRFSKEDDIWLSPGYGRQNCWIGIIMYRPWNNEPPSYWKEYFKEFEEIMKSLDGRPHWAKEHSLNYADFKTMYPKLDEWIALRNRMDPKNLFVNSYLEKIITS
ncbi:putative L-gulonolactone oxidase [Cardiosporidium cionae]|uniref:L-gulonolactone oxidase n=1 Tax=Cardiosporidium cionae TaxID=476202 RepID=A0ABQ7J5R4_9APIC|nr:putative L-gulonolactone oxidase [Cardiosporidium cionae]|eukprot:KAF8819321.1 putative L-gulonolactone oxidase [Cardiosporidium cionae]